MAQNKTTYTNENVLAFIENTAINEQQKQDSLALIRLMEKASGKEAVMWGPSIIGFGKYHYVYASGHQGEAPVLGFSPRKAAISLYVYTGLPEHENLLENLGKYKIGKACIYIKKLSDIRQDVLENMMTQTLDYLKKTYTVY